MRSGVTSEAAKPEGKHVRKAGVNDTNGPEQAKALEPKAATKKAQAKQADEATAAEGASAADKAKAADKQGQEEVVKLIMNNMMCCVCFFYEKSVHHTKSVEWLE